MTGKNTRGEEELDGTGVLGEIHRRVVDLSEDLQEELSEEELQDLFYRRALELSRAPREEPGEGGRVRLVTFRLGTDRYGVALDMVAEIQRAEGITPVPTAPPFVVGVVNLRGNILSITDLQRFFGLKEGRQDRKHRILVVEGSGLRVGLPVDRVDEIIEVPEEDIKPSLSLDKGITEDYIQGIVTLRGEVLVVIDLKKVLSNPRLVVEESV